MNAVIAREIEHFSASARIDLIDDIWSSVSKRTEPSNVELSATDLSALLDSRYQHSLENPNQPTRSLREIAAGQGVFL